MTRATTSGGVIECDPVDERKAMKDYFALYNLKPGYIRISEHLHVGDWTWTKYDESMGRFVHYRKD